MLTFAVCPLVFDGEFGGRVDVDGTGVLNLPSGDVLGRPIIVFRGHGDAGGFIGHLFAVFDAAAVRCGDAGEFGVLFWRCLLRRFRCHALCGGTIHGRTAALRIAGTSYDGYVEHDHHDNDDPEPPLFLDRFLRFRLSGLGVSRYASCWLAKRLARHCLRILRRLRALRLS